MVASIPLYVSYNNKKETIVVPKHLREDAEEMILRLRRQGVKIIGGPAGLWQYLMKDFAERKGL